MPIVSEKHRESRKNIILQAAKEVFINKGFNAATMQDIINASNVSRGGVYTYFKNTEDIFIELLAKRDLEDTWELSILYEGGKTSWQVLTDIIDNIAMAIEQQQDKLVPAIYEYYFTRAWESKRHLPSLELRFESVKDHLAYILQKGIDDKEFTCKAPVEDVARSIITFCDGIYVGSFHLGPEKIQLRKQFNVFKTYIQTCLFD